MRGGVLLPRVVQVVGGNVRQRQVARDPPQPGGGPLLDVEAVIHELDEEVARPEDVPVGGGCLQGLAVLPEPEPGRHLAAGAAGGGDDPLRVPGEQFAVHPGLAEVTLQGGQRGEPEQVVHTLGGLGEQRHVRVGARARHVVVALRGGAPANRLLVPAVLGRDVRLDADDRLDAGRPRLRPEVVGAVDVAVVGDGDGRHARALALGEQVLQPRRAVQHRVLGVHVQVREGPVPLAARRGCRHEILPPSGMRHHAPAGRCEGPGEVTAAPRPGNCPVRPRWHARRSGSSSLSEPADTTGPTLRAARGPRGP